MRTLFEGLSVLIGRASFLCLLSSCGMLPMLLPEIIPITEDVIEVVELIEKAESNSVAPIVPAKPAQPVKK